MVTIIPYFGHVLTTQLLLKTSHSDGSKLIRRDCWKKRLLGIAKLYLGDWASIRSGFVSRGLLENVHSTPPNSGKRRKAILLIHPVSQILSMLQVGVDRRVVIQTGSSPVPEQSITHDVPSPHPGLVLEAGDTTALKVLVGKLLDASGDLQSLYFSKKSFYLPS